MVGTTQPCRRHRTAGVVILSSFPRKRLIGTTRLITGLILFAYVLTHDLNHALGLISLDAMEAGREPFLAFWHFLPIRIAFYLSIFLHLLIALDALYRRRSLHMSAGEAWQLVLGLSLPPLLTLHVIATAVANSLYDLHATYSYVVWTLWVAVPSYGVIQVCALTVAWIHGCIGLRTWLRLKPFYAAWRDTLFVAAILLPVLALLGFVSAGHQIALLSQQPAWMARMWAMANMPDAAEVARLYHIRDLTLGGYGMILGLVIIARGMRQIVERRNAVTVRYADGHQVVVRRGTTLLEASRIGGIPHAAVCGGKGRCSTCRVRVIAGTTLLSPPDSQEIALLNRIGATPTTRLACQAIPTGAVTIAPLLPPMAAPRQALDHAEQHHGKEREIAVLFADIRGFTQLSEHRLPYDVVFLLNRYFRAMGEAVNTAGGRVDKFIGDGVMALFGLDVSPQEACTQAIAAAIGMSANLDQLNKLMAHDLPQPLRIGIGIHVGPTIVGEMGFGGTQAMTAIGDTVNTASRLENATKEFACQLLISSRVAELAKLDLTAAESHDVPLRGRSETVAVYAIADARDLDPRRATTGQPMTGQPMQIA
ncbi:MAG TPA: adenylate/guanylate cyclase domain-containing protein [Dongiaceae bacterium]|nr:adenylate/guanylate cyclase domain-containing protein [Dongiaceae bacterium]